MQDMTVQRSTDADPDALRVSFILRCWVGQERRVRVRLIDVETGVAHNVADLDQLLTLLARLIDDALRAETEGGLRWVDPGVIR